MLYNHLLTLLTHLNELSMGTVSYWTAVGEQKNKTEQKQIEFQLSICTWDELSIFSILNVTVEKKKKKIFRAC